MKKKKILCAALLAVNLAVIWGNSALPGSTSGQISSGLLARLIQAFPFLDFMGETVLRKLGHFSEFACLGLLLSWMESLLGERGAHGIALPLLAGVLTACVDETVQIFSPGRASSLIDVWIDVSGTVTGILLLQIGKIIIKKHSKGGNQ